MSAVWRWISVRHLVGEGGRTLLTLLGVALGVAVFVAIRLANHTAMSSFSKTIDSVAGKANLQVVSDTGGFDERIFPRVRDLPGVDAAAPAVQTYARAAVGKGVGGLIQRPGEHGPFDETLLILGIDVFSERPFARWEPPNGQSTTTGLQFLADTRAAAVTQALARRHHLKLGDPITILAGGVPHRLNVRLIIDSEEMQQALGGNVVVVDIATAQEVFRRFGKLDRIDLIVQPERKEALRAALAGILPPGAHPAQPSDRTEQVENMVEAFVLNLTALSFIALFVALFLIFNAVSSSVVRRRREIGILRALGMERRRIAVMILAEAALVGVVGSACGLLLGTLLAQGALGAVSRTISTLYLVVEARELRPDFLTYVMGALLGIATSLIAALAPAVEAARTPPSLTVRQGTFVEAQPLPVRGWTTAGIACLLLALGIALWTVGRRQPLGGFVSAALLVGGFSLLAPAFTLLCEQLSQPVVRLLAGIEGVLGARYLRDAVARTSVVVAALMVAVGMLVGLSVMVGSFRKTVDVWVNQSIRGDLYVQPVGRDVSGGATVLSEAVVQAARSLPGVAAVDTYRGVQITHGGRIAYVNGIDFDVQCRFGRLQFVAGDTGEILSRALAEDGVIVTESFAFRHHTRVGDRLTLDTPSGPTTFPVEGIYYDYSTDAGAVMMDYHLFARLWHDSRTESVAIYLRPGTDVDRARAAFIQAVGKDVVLYVTPNRALRSRVLTVFDQTFQITYALQAIAMLVAVLGVVSTLTALILQRGREIGVLRAVGALRGQVRRMVLVESGLLGLIGAVLGCVCGFCLSLLLIYVINKQFFGWSIRLTVEPWVFVQSILLMVVTSVLAGIGPARLAASRLAAEAMRAE